MTSSLNFAQLSGHINKVCRWLRFRLVLDWLQNNNKRRCYLFRHLYPGSTSIKEEKAFSLTNNKAFTTFASVNFNEGVLLYKDILSLKLTLTHR